MKQFLKKATAVLLSAAMLSSVGAVAAFAQEDAQPAAADSSYYYGAFYYRPGEGEILGLSDSIDYYAYSDDYFKKDSRVYDDHLSTLSMSLAEASVSSTREPFTEEGYKHKNRDVIAFLEDNGFSDISVNEAYTLKPTKDSIGVACARKRIADDDKTYTLLAIVPRSAGYEAEWGNNFVLGAEGDAQGFAGCAEKCLAFAKDYVAEQQIEGDIKVWTVGYSRGAAITNIIAKNLIDEPQKFIGEAVTLTADNLYAYTYGTPCAADIGNDPRAERYAGIFNCFEDTELPSAMAPADMGFARYGTDIMFKDDSKKELMLANLEICNPVIYDEYVNTTGSYHFSPKKIGLSNGSIGMVNDNNSYIPGDAKTYLEGLAAYLTVVTGGRESFAATYEQPFSDFLAYFQSLTGESSSAFGSALLSSDDSLYLVAAMYAYFMKNKLQTEINPTRAQLTQKAEELAAVSASADDATGIDASVILKLAARLALYLTMDAEQLKKVAAGYLGNVLTNAMTLSGATQEQIDAICNPASLEALAHLISHLLLGNIWQSNAVRPMQLNNEQMKNAATLIGNFTNIMYDHANEVIMSWLRLDDEYFDEYQPLTDDRIAGYRRVYFTAENLKGLNGSVLDSDGDVIGVMENGVLKDTIDKWIGFTTTDEGGFLRIPNGADYSVVLDDFAGDFTASVAQYDVYTASTEPVFRKEVTVDHAKLTLTLGADGTYSLSVAYIKGDANLDGKLNVFDITLMQRALADGVTFTDLQKVLCDADDDGVFTIDDVTLAQRCLAEYFDERNHTGEEVVFADDTSIFH